MRVYNPKELQKLYQPPTNSDGEENGQVTIIGGSKLFHGAPLLSVKVASRIVDMVFFASPGPSIGEVANKIKSKLLSFIWVPFGEVEEYIKKSDAALIGPGFMRYDSEKNKESKKEGERSRRITKKLLTKFPNKRWVIDAGSLQTMDPKWIPKKAILTPNKKEFEMLFGKTKLQDAAKKYNCIIVLKGPETVVVSPQKSVVIKGGNAGLTKGGTGDVQAGLTVALLAKNEPFLAASSAAYLIKATADSLYKKVGVNYNADDLTNEIPNTLSNLL